jgi:hypothetical protein
MIAAMSTQTSAQPAVQPTPSPPALPAHGGLRSLHHRSIIAWRSPGRFTKNPDLVRLPTGRLVFIYSDNDCHWSQETQILTLVASDDDGATWFKLSEIISADLRKGDERLVTPRLSLLSDGRLVALIDHDDFGHFHEDQPFGMWIFFSTDGGLTWTAPVVPAIPGFEPDRVVELPAGRLAVVTQVLRGASQEFAVLLCTSSDGGRSWATTATIADDGYNRSCEGALVVLDGGAELACVMRENHSSGVPSTISFSRDGGHTWSRAQWAPFAIHRPYAKQLPDGRVLVTGRHVNGQVGAIAWAGDLRREADFHAIGGPRSPELASLADGALRIVNGADKRGCRYSLLPPESSLSEMELEARVKLGGGEAGKPIALMSLCKIYNLHRVTPVLYLGTDFIRLGSNGADTQRRVDLTTYRTITLRHRRGHLTVAVDGQVLMNQCIVREEAQLEDWFSESPQHRTMFGNSFDTGTSWWQSVRYRHVNRTQPDWSFAWTAASGTFPNHYQRQRHVLLHGNPPGQDQIVDCGYSSWVLMPDGTVQFVDYSSQGDAPGKSHIVGLRFHPSEIP